jgi:hypothetical protein
MNNIRKRLFQSGSVEELSVLLALVYRLSTHSNKGAAEVLSPQPALELKELKCIERVSYTLKARN